MTLGARGMLLLLALRLAAGWTASAQRLTESVRDPGAAPIAAPASGSLSTSGTVPQSTVEALAHMAALAGVIFAGEVIAVRRPVGFAGSPQSAGEGMIEVEFRVDEAVRGCTAGTPFVLKEWSGLWTGGVDRYTVGQRLLMFLYAPNAQGMSSPINGMDGAVPLQGDGSAPGAADRITTAGTWMVDLRWVQAEVLRGSSSGRSVMPLRAVVLPASQAADLSGPVRAPLVPVAWRAISAMPEANSTESLQVVLTLCREWEQQSYVLP